MAIDYARRTAPITDAGPPAGGMESPARLSVATHGAPAGDSNPGGAGPLGAETSSRAHLAVVIYGAPAGDGSPYRCMPTSWGDTEVCLAGGRCVWSAYRGRQPPLGQVHRVGGRGILPRRQSLLTERLRWTAAPKVRAHQLGER